MDSDGVTTHSTPRSPQKRIDDPRMVAASEALIDIGFTPRMAGCALAAAIEEAPSDWWPRPPQMPAPSIVEPEQHHVVVDLMDALERSVREAREARQRHRAMNASPAKGGSADE